MGSAECQSPSPYKHQYIFTSQAGKTGDWDGVAKHLGRRIVGSGVTEAKQGELSREANTYHGVNLKLHSIPLELLSDPPVPLLCVPVTL